MDHQPASIKFAIIGHQDSWENVTQFVNNIRITNDNELLSLDKIKQVYSFIPPRKLFDIVVNSTTGNSINGAYIDTFISPDELDIKHLRKNIEKVKDACILASKLGASVVSLGGFSSIVLETGKENFTSINKTSFTTGNTLTAGFIAKGIEKACAFWDVELEQSNLLIIGSTGDIGSACVEYFAGKAKKILLCARQQAPLLKQSDRLTQKGTENIASSRLKELIPKADIIISVASSIIENNDLDELNEHCIVCDAGYPKNLQSSRLQDHERLFYGGMGIIKNGFYFENNVYDSLYKFCLPNVSHGCLLEGIVLALENKCYAYSKGRGNITTKVMNEILEMAAKHGIEAAPLFNDHVIESLNEKVYV
jgi:fatty aldehyde-generating acyl-ACP reductase